jgi:NADPH2:quinone reductase
MAHRIRVHQHGGPEVLRYEAHDVPAPGPGEALVRHEAIGLNFIDTYHRTGLYPVPGLPFTPGMEGAGVVEAVGDGVGDLVPGQRVAYAGAPLGAYADRRVMQAGETVLFHAAAGGVGLIFGQWAKHLGVTAIGTVGSEEKAELARAHGYAHVINYKTEDFAARVKEITGGQGVPVVYDGVGKAVFDKSLDCLSPCGLAVNFGNASGPVDALNLLTLSAKGSLFVTRPTLMTYTRTRERLLACAHDLFDVVAQGAVKIEIHQRFPLAEAAEAHRALEGRATTGSSLLIP